jgi:hypothetical protein
MRRRISPNSRKSASQRVESNHEGPLAGISRYAPDSFCGVQTKSMAIEESFPQNVEDRKLKSSKVVY